MDIKEEKNKYRKQVKEAKQKYSLIEKKELSELIWEKVEKENWFINSKTILAYWSMEDEVHTHDFILKWYKEKTFFLGSRTCRKI